MAAQVTVELDGVFSCSTNAASRRKRPTGPGLVEGAVRGIDKVGRALDTGVGCGCAGARGHGDALARDDVEVSDYCDQFVRETVWSGRTHEECELVAAQTSDHVAVACAAAQRVCATRTSSPAEWPCVSLTCLASAHRDGWGVEHLPDLRREAAGAERFLEESGVIVE